MPPPSLVMKPPSPLPPVNPCINPLRLVLIPSTAPPNNPNGLRPESAQLINFPLESTSVLLSP